MRKKNVTLSSIGLKDVNNDTIQMFGGLVVNNLTAGDLVAYFPGGAFFDNTTLGERMLCAVRIDGQPFIVVATNTTDGEYNPPVRNFIRLYGGRHRPRPKKSK